MNVIDTNVLERDAGGKPLHTFPHPALAKRRSNPSSLPEDLDCFEELVIGRRCADPLARNDVGYFHRVMA
jgi:hypothetical protein